MGRELDLKELNKDSYLLNSQETLVLAHRLFGIRLSFACSFGLEDMVILDQIAAIEKPIDVFYLDTGRLPDETYQLIEEAEQKYNNRFRAIYPEAHDVSLYVNSYGINGFYDSVEARKKCCEMRKVRPLTRALEGKSAWINGLRREQSPIRSELEVFSLDEENRVKISPLKDWTWPQLLDYAKTRQVPMNKLHKRGFPSIGCQPCTRPISPGQDFRAGRWWWENNSEKECGLHSTRG